MEEAKSKRSGRADNVLIVIQQGFPVGGKLDFLGDKASAGHGLPRPGNEGAADRAIIMHPFYHTILLLITPLTALPSLRSLQINSTGFNLLSSPVIPGDLTFIQI